MNVSGAIPFDARPVSAAPPVWLRPVALALIVAIHAALFFTMRGQPQPLSLLDSVDVTLLPLGDSPIDQPKKMEESQPEAAPPPPDVAPQEMVAPPPPETVAPPPQVVAPDAVPLPVEPPRTAVKPAVQPRPAVEKANSPRPDEVRERKRKAAEAAERRHNEQQARQEERRGAAGGARAGGMSSASYAGALAAELRRHTFYPAAARAAGVTGSVGVAFTVGPSGRVVSQSITRSSGNAALDGAARAILSAIHPPPPPGGRFSTSTTLHFNFH